MDDGMEGLSDNGDEPGDEAAELAESASESWKEWLEVWDDELGMPYYFNTVTAESVWEKPAAMIEEEQVEALAKSEPGSISEEEHRTLAVAEEPVEDVALPRARFEWTTHAALPEPPAHRRVNKVYGSVIATRGSTLPRLMFVGLPASALRSVVPLRPLPQKSGPLQKRGGKGAFGRRWQRRWFILQGRTLHYFKKPQAKLQQASARLDASSRQHLRFYATRGGGMPAASTSGRAQGGVGAARGMQDRGDSATQLGEFATSASAEQAAAALRAAEPRTKGGASEGTSAAAMASSSAQGSHMQRAALAESLASPDTADSALGSLPLYGAWIRDVSVDKGARAHSFLLLPADGARVFELAAAGASEMHEWLAALEGAGCRRVKGEETS
jgi:hypothetical protein